MPELELGPGPGVAERAMAAVTGEPLSPPHSPETRGSNNNNSRGVTNNNNNISDNNTDKPMDLSSGGGGGLGLTQLFRDAELPPMSPDHPLLTARRLADLVRAQHQQSEQRERESKRKWEDNEETESLTSEPRPPEAVRPLRASPGPSAAAAGCVSGPGSPAGSSSGSESGQSAGPAREEKRRRLDMLLNKKFDNKVVSGLDNNPILMSTPPPSERETSPASDRRPSTESTGASASMPLLAGERRNRRKQSQPGSRPGTPPCISIRPHSDLFPPQPAATSTPRGHKTHEARDYSPARKMSRSQSPPKSPVATKLFNDEKENKDALRNQLLQMQLASSLPGLGGGASPEMLKALQYNPLLYYSYYAQMLTALQAQQKILDMNNTGPAAGNPSNNNNNSSGNSIKDILSPLKLGKDSNQDSRSMLSSYFPPNSPASSLSPLSEEPRKRAPRALTGRYVRTGTAASPRVLQILRKKIEDRLKLKELLGENSHLYFGPVKPNAGSPYKNQIHQKHKKQKI